MPTHVRLAGAHKRTPALHRRTLPSVRQTLARSDTSLLTEERLPPAALFPSTGLLPDPYLDYSRSLTDEGGILIIYKDIDDRLRHIIRRFLVWAIICGLECWYVFHYGLITNPVTDSPCLVAAAVVNWLILFKPIEIYRQIEVRPDCLILDGADIFWRAYMDGGWPVFKADEDGNQVLGGIYGTRFVEYLTVRRFDEEDRAPEIFATHLKTAMDQLWSRN